VRVYQFRHIRAEAHCSRAAVVDPRTMGGLKRALLPVAAALALLTAAAGSARAPHDAPHADGDVEVVVTLPQPPLAEAPLQVRRLASAGARRLDLHATASRTYLRRLTAAQSTFEARLQRSIPDARVRWRYGVTLDGVAVVLPRNDLAALRRIPGATVWPSVSYHEQLDRSPSLIGATAIWGPTLSSAGNGMKIGIIDDGIDQAHPFFSPAGFSYPAGFPKGQTAYTTPKVIVARAYAPPNSTYRYARVPFDPTMSEHATHVAGIAAGDNGTVATDPSRARVLVSGVAPKAYLGNYKVLSVPTAEFGLDGNSPEIAAAIEQAVRDGMDVINLSLGEPEIAPSRDIVVRAINGAADAGVVPVVAAGNDYEENGRGSVGSPGTAAEAITVAASTNRRGAPPDEIASFSSSGPTPVSLGFKPDLTAPGAGILSSVPPSDGSWAVFDGTSMATPHVAGAAAILRQRHPDWTVAQVKSALASTAVDVHGESDVGEAPATRQGGGRIDLLRADQPLVFTSPTGLSLGLVRPGETHTASFSVTDAGGGPDPWTVTVAQPVGEQGATLTATPTVAAPGTVTLTAAIANDAAERDLTGFVLLTRGTDERRVPYWLRVERPKLATEPHRTLTRPGVYGADTRSGRSLVSSYRYPDRAGPGVPTDLAGPELVYRVVLRRPVANVGAVVVSHGRGVRIQPRLVFAGDENRLVGYTALPVDVNPYQDYGRLEPVVGAVRPAPGAYEFVFDTPSRADAGPFSFRFWIGDVSPPRVQFLRRTPTTLVLRVTDAGAGVDRGALKATVDGSRRSVRWRGADAIVATGRLARGTHHVTVEASDFQEAKNMENTGPVLPNTRFFRTAIRVP
jgi:subtilisin family serine protease